MYSLSVSYLSAFSHVAVLFLLIFAGYASRRLGILDSALTRGLSRLIVNLTLPALVIGSLQIGFSRNRAADLLAMVGISAACYGFYFFCAWLLPNLLRAKEKDRGVYRFLAVFSNTGFMGYPMLESFLGPEALFYGVAFNLPYNLLQFTVGVSFLSSPGRTGRGFPWKNPGILATALGLFLFLLPWRLPALVSTPLNILGGMTTPLAMLVIGSLLADLEGTGAWKDPKLYAAVAVRLLVIPGAVCAGLAAAGFGGFLRGVPVLLSAMPAAANISILAAEYGGEAELASRLVFVTTLLSGLTLPLFAGILG